MISVQIVIELNNLKLSGKFKFLFFCSLFRLALTRNEKLFIITLKFNYFRACRFLSYALSTDALI